MNVFGGTTNSRPYRGMNSVSVEYLSDSYKSQINVALNNLVPRQKSLVNWNKTNYSLNITPTFLETKIT